MKQVAMIFTMMLMLVGCADQGFETDQPSSEGTNLGSSFGANFGGEPTTIPKTESTNSPDHPLATDEPDANAPIPPIQANSSTTSNPRCRSNFIVGTVTTSPTGVSREIVNAYDDILGQIEKYTAGGRYLTDLQAQGFTVLSLRRDLLKTPEHTQLLTNVYQHHLKRLPTIYETVVHFNDIMIEAKNMRQIEAEVYARCLNGE